MKKEVKREINKQRSEVAGEADDGKEMIRKEAQAQSETIREGELWHHHSLSQHGQPAYSPCSACAQPQAPCLLPP